MSISKRKLAANRANAKKSTGPTSSAGLARAAQNRISHGLCGKFLVLESESQEEYNDLLERFLRAEQPVDDVERELVAKMARHTWMSERAVRCQTACFQHRPATPEQKAHDKQTVAVLKDLDLYLRYQTFHDRAYQRAAAELAKRRKDKMLLARGFESQKHAAAEAEHRAKRQNQRDELHPFRVMTAEMNVERLAQRVLTAGAGFQPPQSGQFAA